MDFITAQIAFLAKFFLNNNPEDMTVADTTDYTNTADSVAGEYDHPAVTESQVEIVFDAFLPNGNIFHDGDDTFVVPDIDRGVTDNISGIVITKDANGNLLTGDYSFDYKMKITDELLTLFLQSATHINPSLVQVRAAGDFVDFINNSTSLEITGSNAGLLDDTYSLDAVSYNGVNTVIQLIPDTISIPLTITAPGQLDVKATGVYTISKKLNYNYIPSSGKITLSADCDKSELRSRDATDYSQYDNNAPVTRNHTLRYPIDLVPPQGDITSQNEIISVNPIYTNLWTATIEPVVQITQSDGLLIEDVLNATESIDVQCGSQWCLMFECLENIGASYERAIEDGNSSEIRRWGLSWSKIKGYHMLWRIARSCGDATTAAKYAALALEEANAQDCCTGSDADLSEPSKLIQAITAGGITTIYNELVNQWFSGVGPPSPALHDDGDYYLNVVNKPDPGNGDVYLKTAGSWAVQTNISGEDGLNGTDGTDGSDGNDGLRGSQFFGEDDPVSVDPAGAEDGDFNIKPDATIQKRGLTTPDVWDEFADPNGLRGSQIFNINALPTTEGEDGDFNIRDNAIIDKKVAGVWEVFADPNGAAGVSGLYINTVEASGPESLNVWEILRSYSIQPGEVSVNDTLLMVFDVELDLAAGSLDSTRFRIEWPGQQFTFTIPTGHNMAMMELEIAVRTGGTSGACLWTVKTGVNTSGVTTPAATITTVYHFNGSALWIGDIINQVTKVDFNIYTELVGQQLRSQMSRIDIIKKS